MKNSGDRGFRPPLFFLSDKVGDELSLEISEPVIYNADRKTMAAGRQSEVGMLYLFLAVVSSALVSILMRISEKYVRGNMVMFCANYAVCAAISLAYMGGIRPLASDAGIGTAVTLGAVTGFLYLAGFVLLQKNVSCNGVILSGAAMKLGGVLIPIIAAVLLLQERMKWLQLAGAVLAVAAIVLINTEKGEVGTGVEKHWLAVLLLVSGISDTMANIFDKTGPADLKNLYLFCTFFAVMLMAFALARQKRQRITAADLLCGLLIGIPNYYSARFLLLSLGSLPAVVVYPVFNVGTIIVITAAGAVFFHEKLSGYKKCALLLILAALVILNL